MSTQNNNAANGGSYNLKDKSHVIARRVQRLLSAFEYMDRAKGLVNVTTSNPEFNTLVTDGCRVAEEAIVEILDHVDGPALTAFDTMLDEVRKTREWFFKPTAGAAVEAAKHARAAHQLVGPAVIAVHEL